MSKDDEVTSTAGDFIGIETDSMRANYIGCGGRAWRVKWIPADHLRINPDSLEEVEGGEGWVCEHMLEMD